eukprot:403341209
MKFKECLLSVILVVSLLSVIKCQKCFGEKQFPIIFGDGTTHMGVSAIAQDLSTGDIIFGGQHNMSPFIGYYYQQNELHFLKWMHIIEIPTPSTLSQLFNVKALAIKNGFMFVNFQGLFSSVYAIINSNDGRVIANADRDICWDYFSQTIAIDNANNTYVCGNNNDGSGYIEKLSSTLSSVWKVSIGLGGSITYLNTLYFDLPTNQLFAGGRYSATGASPSKALVVMANSNGSGIRANFLNPIASSGLTDDITEVAILKKSDVSGVDQLYGCFHKLPYAPSFDSFIGFFAHGLGAINNKAYGFGVAEGEGCLGFDVYQNMFNLIYSKSESDYSGNLNFHYYGYYHETVMGMAINRGFIQVFDNQKSCYDIVNSNFIQQTDKILPAAYDGTTQFMTAFIFTSLLSASAENYIVGADLLDKQINFDNSQTCYLTGHHEIVHTPTVSVNAINTVYDYSDTTTLIDLGTISLDLCTDFQDQSVFPIQFTLYYINSGVPQIIQSWNSPFLNSIPLKISVNDIAGSLALNQVRQFTVAAKFVVDVAYTYSSLSSNIPFSVQQLDCGTVLTIVNDMVLPNIAYQIGSGEQTYSFDKHLKSPLNCGTIFYSFSHINKTILDDTTFSMTLPNKPFNIIIKQEQQIEIIEKPGFQSNLKDIDTAISDTFLVQLPPIFNPNNVQIKTSVNSNKPIPFISLQTNGGDVYVVAAPELESQIGIYQIIITLQDLSTSQKQDYPFTLMVDEIRIKFVQYYKYQSTDLNRFIPNNTVISTKVPLKQQQTFMDFADGMSTGMSVTLSSIIGTNLLLNFFVAQSAQQLWGMVEGFQYIAHLPLMSVTTPANTLYFFQLMNSIASFNLIETEEFTNKFLEFDEYDETYYSDPFFMMGYETMNAVQNLGQLFYMILINAFILILALLINLTGVKNKSCILARIDKSINHNFILRFIQEAYFEFFLSSIINLHYQIQQTLNKNNEKSNSYQFSNMILMYIPLSIFRRIIYLTIMLFLRDQEGMQIILQFQLVMYSLAYISVYRPFEMDKQNTMAIINETILLILVASFVPFTSSYCFDFDDETFELLGYVPIGFTLFYLAFNIMAVLIENIQTLIQFLKQKCKKQEVQINVDELSIKQIETIESCKAQEFAQQDIEINCNNIEKQMNISDQKPILNLKIIKAMEKQVQYQQYSARYSIRQFEVPPNNNFE